MRLNDKITQLMERERELHIIKRIRSGEKDCYKELVDEYSAQIFSFIRGIVANHQDAQDIAQEVFIKGFFRLDRYRADSSFLTWIYRIAYNETISHLRKKNRKHTLNFIENIDQSGNYADSLIYSLEEDGVKLKIEKEDKFERIARAMEKLEADQQFLIIQFYYKNCSIKELQQITGLSESNVKTKLFRARQELINLTTSK